MNSVYIYGHHTPNQRMIRIACLLFWAVLFANCLQGQQISTVVPERKGDRFIFYNEESAKRVYVNWPNDIPVNQYAESPVVATYRSSKFRPGYVQKPPVVLGNILLNIQTIEPGCNRNNGTIIATASGGTFPYTYELKDRQTLRIGYFPRLPAGSYTLTVTDADGQTVSQEIKLTNAFSPPSLSVQSYNYTSGCAIADASVTLKVTGGTPPYEYSMDAVNYQPSPVFSNLYSGGYLFHVRDANGCIGTFSAFNLNFLSKDGCNSGLGYSNTVYSCKNEGNITASLNPPQYEYSLDGVNYQPTINFMNLASGFHKLHRREKATGKVSITVVTIFQSCTIVIDYIIVDAACKENDGMLTVVAKGGEAPYSYTIDGINYQASSIFKDLPPGTYNVTVKDANGYTNTSSATVYDRCPVVTAVSTNENCGQRNGKITVTGTKGTAPYQYSLNGINFQNGNVFTGLVKGNYTITIKDALGFTGTTTIVVSNTCLSISTDIVNATCSDANGKITAKATGGNLPYQYSLDDINFQSSGIFIVGQGDYVVTVKDMSGSKSSVNVTVGNIPGPQLTLSTTLETCAGSDAIIIATGADGLPPFQYSIDGNVFQSTNVFKNIPAGQYTVWIRDGNQCVESAGINVLQNCPTIIATRQDETCNNGNGSITVAGANGTPPYHYSIDGINFQDNGFFPGLKAGSYTITIKDAVSTKNVKEMSIVNVCPTVSIQVTDGYCGIGNGQIIATGANGKAPYQYATDGINFQSSNIFTNLSAGTYKVSVKDAYGLIASTSATVNNFPGPQLSVSSTAATCMNDNGVATATASGGNLPLLYSINNGNFQQSPVFDRLASGDYIITIKDRNGCSSSQPVTINLSNDMLLDVDDEIEICEGESRKIVATSNASAFQWSPLPGLSGSDILESILTPTMNTKYFVTATLGSCIQKDSVMVWVHPAPLANAGHDTTICFGQSAQLNGSGGSVYSWTPSSYLDKPNVEQPVVVKPQQSTTYQLNVIDGNGCKSLHPSPVTITVTPPVRIFTGNDTSIVIHEPFQLMATDVNNSGLAKYQWSPSSGLSNNLIKNPVAILDEAITYTITAWTNEGCEGSDRIQIKVYKGPEIYVPTAFTPGSDGKNDILKVIPIGVKIFSHFTIYNRWGQRVFYTTDPSKGWDGNYNGVQQDTNVFVWMVEGVDDKGRIIKKKGTVALIR